MDSKILGEMFAPQYVASNKWVLPASYLEYGEKPDDAAMRILTKQVGLGCGNPQFRQVQSHLRPSPVDPDEAYWDIRFVYEGNSEDKMERPEWFSELRFVNPAGLTSGDFTRGHGDVLQEFESVRNLVEAPRARNAGSRRGSHTEMAVQI